MISSTSGGEASSGFAGTSFSSTRPTRCRCGCSAAPPIGAGRSLAGAPGQELQVRLARELVTPCQQHNRQTAELDEQLKQRVKQTAPGLLELPGGAAVTAAKLLAEIGPIDRFQIDAQLA